MSGGGKRSASFGYGALKGMRQVRCSALLAVQSPLLHQVSAIAGVSGGSFPAAYYGLYHDAAFGRFETDFLYQDTESYIWGIVLLPWNWTWLGRSARSAPTTSWSACMTAPCSMAPRIATWPSAAVRSSCWCHDLAYGNPVLFTQEKLRSDLFGYQDVSVGARGGRVERVSGAVLADHTDQSRGRLWRPADPAGCARSAMPNDTIHCRGSACRLRLADRYLDTGERPATCTRRWRRRRQPRAARSPVR